MGIMQLIRIPLFNGEYVEVEITYTLKANSSGSPCDDGQDT